MKSLLYGIAITFLLNACATYQPGMGNLNMAAPTSKSKIVGTAIGTAEVKYILGFGGMNRQGLLWDAKRKLQKNYPLAPSQIYTYTTIDIKKSFYLVYWSTKLTLTADILDYEPEQNKALIDSLKAPLILSDGISQISEGDTVFFEFRKQTQRAIVIYYDKEKNISLGF